MSAPEQIVVRVLGVTIELPAPDAETAERLRHQWARALTDAPAEHVLEDPIDAADRLVHDYTLTVLLTLRALGITAGSRLNIHAGAVADGAGRALAVIGESGSGKTTAIRALAARLGYLSDETVSLTDDLSIHPYPKPLSVVIDPDEPRRKATVSPDDAGLLTPPEDSTLRRIVLLRRGHGTHGLVPVNTAAAIVEIVPQTSSLIQLDHPLLRLAATIDRCGGAFALHYDEVHDHLDEIVDLLDSDPAPVAPPVHHPPVPLPEPDRTQWSRSSWLDAVQYDDELVVMVAEIAHLVGGIGTTLWLALAQPATAAHLVVVAETEHGAHPDAAGLVDRALAQLHESGLLNPPA